MTSASAPIVVFSLSRLPSHLPLSPPSLSQYSREVKLYGIDIVHSWRLETLRLDGYIAINLLAKGMKHYKRSGTFDASTEESKERPIYHDVALLRLFSLTSISFSCTVIRFLPDFSLTVRDSSRTRQFLKHCSMSDGSNSWISRSGLDSLRQLLSLPICFWKTWSRKAYESLKVL